LSHSSLLGQPRPRPRPHHGGELGRSRPAAPAIARAPAASCSAGWRAVKKTYRPSYNVTEMLPSGIVTRFTILLFSTYGEPHRECASQRRVRPGARGPRRPASSTAARDRGPGTRRRGCWQSGSGADDQPQRIDTLPRSGRGGWTTSPRVLPRRHARVIFTAPWCATFPCSSALISSWIGLDRHVRDELLAGDRLVSRKPFLRVLEAAAGSGTASLARGATGASHSQTSSAQTVRWSGTGRSPRRGAPATPASHAPLAPPPDRTSAVGASRGRAARTERRPARGRWTRSASAAATPWWDRRRRGRPPPSGRRRQSVTPPRLAGPGAYSFFRARTALAASAAESRAT
jgi:hypothetical protein